MIMLLFACTDALQTRPKNILVHHRAQLECEFHEFEAPTCVDLPRISDMCLTVCIPKGRILLLHPAHCELNYYNVLWSRS